MEGNDKIEGVDFLKPDHIVVGVSSTKAEDVMRNFYKSFILNGHPTIFMDVPSAEMTKYADNSMLATKISFMNDIANLLGIKLNTLKPNTRH